MRKVSVALEWARSIGRLLKTLHNIGRRYIFLQWRMRKTIVGIIEQMEDSKKIDIEYL